MNDAEEPPRCRGGARRISLPEGRRLVISELSLVIDQARAIVVDLPPPVHVWAEVVGHGPRTTIGKLSLENPIVPVRPAVELGGGDFVIRHDSAWSTVRLHGYYTGQPEPNPEGEGEPPTTTTTGRTHLVENMYAEEVPDEEEEEQAAWVEYEPLTEEDMAERYDSDNSEDDDYEEEDDRHPCKGGDREAAGESSRAEEDMAERYDSDNSEDDDDEEDDRHQCKGGDREAARESSRARNSIGLVNAPTGIVVPNGEFLGPAQFAAVKNTAGFMRIAAAGAAGRTTGSQEDNDNKEILVLYRYTRFSRTWSGRRGVEACRRTKLHWLRFAVSHAGDMESALAWAGSSLRPLIYPGLFRRELGDLWSSLLVAPAVNAANIIPPQATRLQVVVDAGILRREDYTAERMEHMRGALEATAGEAWPEFYHVGMELRLPEPVWRKERGYEDGDEDDGARPAKRRRVLVAEGEECSLCLDSLESGLAAWPGCGHVFHGQCVEQTLAGRATCPLCRHHLLFEDALVS